MSLLTTNPAVRDPSRRGHTPAPDRQPVAELMDDPALPPARHRAALRGLERLNRLAGASGAIWRAIRGRLPAARGLRLLDVGSGGGDVLLGLARRARREGVDLEITACDISRVASGLVEDRFERAGLSVASLTIDVLRDPLPGGFDVVTSSLFLHHLTTADVGRLLTAMRCAAGALVVADDLVRCRSGYLLAAAVPRLVTRSRVVHVDARRSVRSAFTAGELRDLAISAGIAGAVVRRHWPARMMLLAPGSAS